MLVPDGTQLYLGTPHSYYSIYADAALPEIGETRPFLDGFERSVYLGLLRRATGLAQAFPHDRDEAASRPRRASSRAR